jgi:hypothetical protein
MAILLYCDTEPLMQETGKIHFTALTYSLARVVFYGGRDGRLVLTTDAAGWLTDR